MTKVSIIIPVYNVSDYIERCVGSVMNQTYQNIECILVDDCSPDDSITKAESMISQYGGPIEFMILHHQENKGLSGARNTGIKHSTGDYLYFLDSDDEITPTCVESLMRAAREDPSSEIVQGYSCCPLVDPVLPDRERLAKQLLPLSLKSNEDIRLCYYKKTEIIRTSAWDKLVKRSFMLNHNLLFREGVCFEDTLWLFYVFKYITSINLVRDHTHFYHIRSNSINITGNGEIVNAPSWVVIYNDVLANLSEGWERKEMAFFADGFCRRYVECRLYVAPFRDVFSLYWKKAWHYGCMMVLMRLMLAYILGNLKHGSKVLAWLESKK